VSWRAITPLVAVLVALSDIYAQSDERKLTLSIAGGLPAARTMTVVVLSTGDLRATGEGLPFTESGLTTLDHHRRIGAADAERLFALAERAAVGWKPTRKGWPDCTFANLQIRRGTKPLDARSGCITPTWYRRDGVDEFLTLMDGFLPATWTASEVLRF
jgi:hypothetical protein